MNEQLHFIATMAILIYENEIKIIPISMLCFTWKLASTLLGGNWVKGMGGGRGQPSTFRFSYLIVAEGLFFSFSLGRVKEAPHLIIATTQNNHFCKEEPYKSSG